MDWRQQVAILENEGNFDIAVFLLEKVIQENPDEMDAYIMLLYRFMDSFLENACYWANSQDPLRKIKEEYCHDKVWHDYTQRAEKCFDESYARFSDNPEYIYYVSKILLHACCFMFLDSKENLLNAMYQQAKVGDYNSILVRKYPNDPDNIMWATHIVNDPSFQEQLATKGAAAEYVIGGEVSWAKKILEDAHKDKAESK